MLVVYRLLVDLLQPYPLLLFSLLAALVWTWRTTAAGRRSLVCAALAWAALYIVSTPLAAYFAIGSLEWQIARPEIAPAANDTIVVLSGSVFVDNSEGTKYRVGPDTFYRCLQAVERYRAAGGCRLLLTGGKTDWSKPGPTLAGAMKEFVIANGVRESDILIEEKSMTTYENAANSGPHLLDSPKVFLVTDHTHLPRATRCFAAQGIKVIPDPANSRAGWLRLGPESVLPSATALAAFQEATHEWLGLAWYWLRGRI